MIPWTADHRHLALVGLPASAMVADARAVAGTCAPGTFELPSHGFSGAASLTGAPERVRFSGNAVNGIALDSNIVATAYYDVDATGAPDFFSVGLNGVPLVLAGDGVGLPYVIENIVPKIDLIMRQWTSVVVSAAKAYKAPWQTPPEWAPLLISHLAAPTVTNMLRVASARFDVSTVIFNTTWAEARLVSIDAGTPYDDGTGPIDNDSIPNDAARATNGILSGCVAPTPWLTGWL